MTLGATPTIAQIVAEIGETLPYTFQTSDPRPWDLAGLATSSSLVFPTSFANKSVVTQTDIETTASTSHAGVSFGADGDDRWMVVLAFHGNTSSNPGDTPTATIGGVAATRIHAGSTGNGSGLACGSAIFVAQPAGTSGTVAVSWGGLDTIIVVLRVVGYDLSAAHSSDGASSPDGSSALSVNIPSLGLQIGCEINNGTTTTEWTNLTKANETTVFSSKSISYGWDYNMGSETGRAVSWTPYSSSQGTSSGRAASFART